MMNQNKTKHTPGQWTYARHTDEITVDAGDIYGAATLPISEPDFPAGEQLANARLIAAAPELLKALDRIVRYGKKVVGQSNRGAYPCPIVSLIIPKEWFDAAHTALDRARGQA